MVEVKLLKLENFDQALELPHYQSAEAAGADIRACLPKEMRDRGFVVEPGERLLIPTGLAMEIPNGYEIQIRPRSGLSFKTGLMVVNSPGTIDSDYRGELKVIIGNLGQKAERIGHGDRIAQMVIAPLLQAKFLTASELSDSERGAGGFGSTGHQ